MNNEQDDDETTVTFECTECDKVLEVHEHAGQSICTNCARNLCNPRRFQ